MALYHSPRIVTDGLVLCLDAANVKSYPGSGTTAVDVASNIQGSLVNGVSYSAANKGYFEFDGTNDYITFGNTTTANVFTQNFTISAWVYRLSNTGPYWGNIIGDYYTQQNSNEWQIMLGASAEIFVYRIGTGYIITGTSSGYTSNQWFNVTVSRIGSTVTLYTNGNSIATSTNSDTWGSATGNLNIGIDGNNSSEPLNGRISNVLIYKNVGLSSDQVKQNFQALRGRYGV